MNVLKYLCVFVCVGGKGGLDELFTASSYGWYLGYCALCDNQVLTVSCGQYLSPSTDRAPELVSSKRSKEDQSLQASRVQQC